MTYTVLDNFSINSKDYSLVKIDLEKRFANIKIFNLYDGLVHYKFDGNSRELEKIIYFNNTFFVLKTMKGKGLNFPSLTGALCSSKNYFLVNKGSFRVRFVQENQFAKVDKNLARRAEEYVLANSKLKLDRLSPTNEVWFSIRREGFAFCGELISKREFTEKNLHKGELRPEIAYFMCCYAQLEKGSVVADPFCGYGSIPAQLKKRFDCQKIFASDINGDLVGGEVQQADAFELNQIEDASLDAVITDPPWGLWEDISDMQGFYKKMFESFKRVLKADGKMVILSARIPELEAAAKECGAVIQKSLHTLVNGKKATLFYLTYGL